MAPSVSKGVGLARPLPFSRMGFGLGRGLDRVVMLGAAAVV